MSNTDIKKTSRKKWTNADLSILIQLWEEYGSVMIISKIMNRAPSSIQTQASRRNLPKRDVGSNKHRKKWTKADDEYMLSFFKEGTPDGSIDITNIANKCNRSVDAIFNRLVDKHHWNDNDLLKKLKIPGSPDILLNLCSAKPKTKSKPNGAGEKRCPRCFKPFYSDGSWQRICQSCKRTDDWKSSSSF